LDENKIKDIDMVIECPGGKKINTIALGKTIQL
jgi:ATP-dependent protease ClpP protease subunit